MAIDGLMNNTAALKSTAIDTKANANERVPKKSSSRYWLELIAELPSCFVSLSINDREKTKREKKKKKNKKTKLSIFI